MASQRITAAIRDAIVNAAVAKRFAKENVVLKDYQTASDEANRNANKLAYKEAFEPKHHTLLKKLPDGWLGWSTSVNVQISGSHVQQLKFGEDRPVPRKYQQGRNVTRIIEPDNPALVARDEHKRLCTILTDYQHELGKDISALRVRIRAVIESVTTTGRLLEVWPECQDLLPPESLSAGAMLPAINLVDLNKELGLV